MRVAKAVTADQYCVSFVDTTDERSMEGLKRLREELVELKSASNQCSHRKLPALGTQVRPDTLVRVEELPCQIGLPANPFDVGRDQRMMHAAMKVINEIPVDA